MIDAINVNELRKNYGPCEVLKGIEFKVKKGEIFALLGINGAGKTTTLEIIEGLRKYDSGTITVAIILVTCTYQTNGSNKTFC